MIVEMPEPDFPLAVDVCIYCGAEEGLTDEHVVPYSLGGTWELKRASCTSCQKITSQLERKVSRGDFLALRTVGKFPSYHPKNRPSELSQAYELNGQREEVVLPPHEHPAPFIMLTFAPPSILSGEAHTEVPHVSKVRVFSRTGKVQQLGRDLGATGLTVGLPDRVLFARFLAKVALAYAVASPGLAAMKEVFVRDAILGRTNDVGRWVGCVTQEAFTSGVGLHEIVSIVREGRVEVAVKLFSSMDTPEYRVVVGSAVEQTAQL